MRRDETGAASVLVVAVSGLLMAVGCALAAIGGLVTAHRSAQSAADLSALAGAQALRTAGDACGASAATATANGAELVSCAVVDRDVRVRVRVTAPTWLGRRADLVAEARAGPAG